MSHRPSGKLIVISGPSGSGKTTVVAEVRRRLGDKLVASVSATTRPPRPGELDGQHYHFLTDDEFQRRRQAGEFLEAFEVFGRGYWYGTPKGGVQEALDRGSWVLLEIDVQGALEISRQFPEAETIFIEPGSLEELERRLRDRGTEIEEEIQARLEVARHELEAGKAYRHQVVNDDVNRAATQICDILCQDCEDAK